MSKVILTRESLAKLAEEESLELIGLVDLKEDSFSYGKYLDWLKEKKHGGMVYMENHKNFRKSPSELLEGAKSSLVLGYNYYLGDKLSDLSSGKPRIAQYARLKDYHKFLRKKSNRMIAYLKESFPNLKSRVLVDSAPFLEKALAAKSKEGFIGKNTLFIHPRLGSYYSLVEIFLDQELSYDKKISVDPKKRTSSGGCGSCRRCSVHCPTGALDKEYVLDASKCLSYYTIEHRGPVPLEYWPHFKKYLFGCDICQLVCPYNKKVSLTEKMYQKLGPHIDLFEVATMNQEFYEKTFGGTPLTRAKKEGLQRNALIAMKVTGDPRLKEALQFLKKVDIKEVLAQTITQVEEAKILK